MHARAGENSNGDLTIHMALKHTISYLVRLTELLREKSGIAVVQLKMVPIMVPKMLLLNALEKGRHEVRLLK